MPNNRKIFQTVEEFTQRTELLREYIINDEEVKLVNRANYKLEILKQLEDDLTKLEEDKQNEAQENNKQQD